MDDFFGVSVVQMFQRERSNQQQAHKRTNEKTAIYWEFFEKSIDQMKFEYFYNFNLLNDIKKI